MSIIKFSISADSSSSAWYHQITLSSLSTTTGPASNVEYICLAFEAPIGGPSSISVDNVSFNAVWPAVNPPKTTVTPLSTGNSRAEVLISFDKKINLGEIDGITIGVNGSKEFAPGDYMKTFTCWLNSKPDINGKVEISCAKVPSNELANIQPTIVIGNKTQQLEYNKTTKLELQPDSYQITTGIISLPDHTVYAAIQSSTNNIQVETGKTSKIDVSFGTVIRTSALEIKVKNIKALETELLNISVYDGTNLLANFDSKINETHSVKELAAQGSVKICIMPISLNNVNYSFVTKTVILNNTSITVNIDDTWVSEEPISTTDFISVNVKLNTTTPLDRQITVRLCADHMQYAALFNVASSTDKFPYPVKPGTYKVKLEDFIDKMQLYSVESDHEMNINQKNLTIDLTIESVANLKVPGFPSFLSFGGCGDLQASNEADFVQAKASAIFKYSGTDGAGDASTYLSDDSAVRRTIAMARSVETKIGNNHITMPTMVSYTCNLSGGDAATILQDADKHNHSYANYILALTIACKNVDANHPVAACFVLNPDFLGECEKICETQNIDASKYEMPVIDPLQKAIDYSVEQKRIPALKIPDDIENNIRGYVRSVNWLTRAVAGNKVCFGWQTNLWGVGRSEWIYEDKNVKTIGQKMANFAKSCGISATDKYPVDFHAVDRYERDDFFQDAFANGYCYGPSEWERYFDFCAAVCKNIKLPLMAWQIPASHVPLTTDSVNTDFATSQRWGTGGSYIFGHPELKNDVANINHTVSSFTFPRPIGSYKNMGELFSKPFDLSKPKYLDFALRGIFAVLLGGGTTTGIISTVGDKSSWVREKLNKYSDNPVKF